MADHVQKHYRLITVTLDGNGGKLRTIRDLIQAALALKSGAQAIWPWNDTIYHVQIHPDGTNDVTIGDAINGDNWDMPASKANFDYIIDADDAYDSVTLRSAHVSAQPVQLEFMLIPNVN